VEEVDGELAGEAVVREGITGAASAVERVTRASADEAAGPDSAFLSAGVAVARA